MTLDEMEAVIFAFPGAERGTSYGQPAYKLGGKLLTRLRAEDDSLVLQEVPIDERDFLIEADPDTFHVTPHYKDYPAVLARRAALQPEVLASFLERRFRKIAKRAEVKAWDEGRKRAAETS